MLSLMARSHMGALDRPSVVPSAPHPTSIRKEDTSAERLAALEEKIAAATPRPPTHKKPKEEAKKEAEPVDLGPQFMLFVTTPAIIRTGPTSLWL